MTSTASTHDEHDAWIGLGSNLGDRRATLDAAVSDLAALGRVANTSTFRETAPVGVLDQPRFLNGAAHLRTSLTPRCLLEGLLEIERAHGRERDRRAPRFGPRVLDLDLLLFEDRVIDEPGLTVPHPRLHEREFALEPLCEIAPDLLHPSFGVSVSVLLARVRAP